jgi:uncharacterized protein YwgA
MKARHLILMLLKASGGKIGSKTKIQKQIYFLSLLFKTNMGFRAHYYGPYSPDVEQGIDELIGAGFVNMDSTYFGFNTNKGFEIKRYDFSLTDSGNNLAKILTKENPEKYHQIRTFIDALKNTGNPDYMALSIAAKAYFILDQAGKPLTTEQLREKAQHLSWQVEKEDVDKAIDILGHLNFVQKINKK